MRCRSFSLAVSLVMLAGLSGCADSSNDATNATNKVRTSDELAATLLSVDDLDGEWTIDTGPQDGALLETGVVTEEGRDLLPTIDLCPDASQPAQDAAEKLSWQAYRQLERAEDDPIDPPTDREGHMEFVQQYLMSDDPDVLSVMFDDLADGFVDCLGEMPAGEEGPGITTEVDIEPVGDQRIAVLATVEEAGGEGTWHVYSTLVRSGSVFMSLVVVDIVLGDLPLELTVTEVNRILSTAVAKV